MDRPIVVIAEHFQGEIKAVTYELAAFAVKLRNLRPANVKILVLGDRIAGLARNIADHTGLDVIGIQEPALRSYQAEVYKELLGELLPDLQPSYVCVAHSSAGWDYAAALAVRLGSSCITGVERVFRKDGLISFTRSVYNGKIVAEVTSRTDTTILTLQPGKVKPLDPGGLVQPGSVAIRTSACPSRRSRFIEIRRVREESAALARAEVIVSAGRGIGKKENVELVSRLADLFHKSAVGGSRSVCDLGWLEYKNQVGITGTTVTPRLYVACGISGAFQHVVGMEGAEFIVAVNTDPNAPIFNVADICIIDDVIAFIPAFLEAWAEGKGGPKDEKHVPR